MNRMDNYWSIFRKPIHLITHWLRRNTRENSRNNIAAHYDLSNEMYQLMLDPLMQYSSAIYATSEQSLEQAQINKLSIICDSLELSASDHLLEIGSGWGGLACFAAKKYGCKVTTITLSQQQYEYAKNKIQDEGLNDRVDIIIRDYRDLEGQYSKIVSIEMIEAVGREYLGDYFRIIKQSLKPGAKAVLQSITISDDRYETYSRGCDWIQKYIFPGGHLPSVGAIRSHVNAVGSLKISSVDSFGKDYAETLRRWAGRFSVNKARVHELGFDAAFCRKWNYYLSYCEAGFDADLIDVNHVVLKRSGS